VAGTKHAPEEHVESSLQVVDSFDSVHKVKRFRYDGEHDEAVAVKNGDDGDVKVQNDEDVAVKQEDTGSS
jgi:hypothetical protein